MKINIREADLHEDREAIVTFCRDYLTSEASLARFDWLYQDNPFGPARVWLANAEFSDDVMGLSVAFPRRLSIEGNDRIGWVLGDFCIHPSCRSLGPALQLQKACLRDLGALDDSLIYDFPSQKMMAIYKRMGIQSCGTHARFVKPLRIDHILRGLTPWKGVETAVARMGNFALQCRDWKLGKETSQVALHEGLCGEEFTSLFERAKCGLSICTVRSSSYLNWRFKDHPHEQYDLWTYRDQGDLRGYLVALQTEHGIRIIDFLSEDQERIIPQLLRMITQHYRQQGIPSIELCFLSHHPFRKQLQKMHFIKREGNDFVVTGQAPWISQAHSPQDYVWWLTSGDRDS